MEEKVHSYWNVKTTDSYKKKYTVTGMWKQLTAVRKICKKKYTVTGMWKQLKAVRKYVQTRYQHMQKPLFIQT